MCLTETALLRIRDAGLERLGACTDRLLSCQQQSWPLRAPHTRLCSLSLTVLPNFNQTKSLVLDETSLKLCARV